MLFIRPASVTEAKDIAEVQVESWRETYQGGMIPDHVLKENKIENRIPYWTHFLRNMPEKTAVYVAEFWGGSPAGVVGFVLAGPEKVGLTEYEGEIQALYLKKAAKGKGIGKKLMKAGAKHLLKQGLIRTCVWAVFENENARSFYEYMGGKPVGSRYLDLPPSRIRESAYGWASAQEILDK